MFVGFNVTKLCPALAALKPKAPINFMKVGLAIRTVMETLYDYQYELVKGKPPRRPGHVLRNSISRSKSDYEYDFSPPFDPS